MPLLGFNRQDIRLILNFFKVTVRDRFLGSILGMFWAVVSPLLMLGIFTFVFGFVFKARLPGSESSLAYVIWLISGYGAWLAIVDGLTTSMNSVVTNSTIVKNLAFKTEVLPIAGGLIGLVPLAVSLAFLVVLLIVEEIPWTIRWFYILPIIGLQFLLVIGLGFVLAAINVFVRDVSMLLPNLLLLVLFGSPIFYPIDAFPAILRPIAQFNPFYLITEGFRRPLIYNQLPPLWTLAYLSLVSCVIFLGGLRVFRRLRWYFDGRL